ncbi:hypothetical protein ACXHXM_16805
MIGSLILGFFKGPLGRILDTIDKNTDATTERDRIKTEAVQSYVNAQAQVLTGRGWWFPVLFLAPAGFWFGAVCVYSVLWCRDCAYPREWTIAALPPPLSDWMGAIVGSLFIGKAGEQILAKWRSK